MTTQLKHITISQAEKEESSSLWALNTSHLVVKDRGIVNISIAEGNGNSTVVRLPVTRIPIDLSTQATKSAIIQSPNFRRMITRGIVQLVSSESAESYMLDPVAAKEGRRVASQLAGFEEIEPGAATTAPIDLQNMVAESSGEIGGFALNLAHITEGDEESVLASLENNADTLSKSDFQYIVNNSKFARVKARAAELAIQ